MEERTAKKPVIVSDSGIKKLDRVLFNSKDFQEAWLQELLAKEPSILPTASVDPIYAPLFCIGREIAVASGSIDNLYISPKGYIVIVETKLWRNPEARRVVVGQIIDYAKDLKEWDYEKLDAAYRSYNKSISGIFSAMLSNCLLREDNEAAFVDITEKNIKQARFLLMIVGDGIREGVERMAEFLNETPNMQYRLALCELEVYNLGNNERLVIPQLTTKTTVVERGIIRVEGPSESIKIEMSKDEKALDDRIEKHFSSNSRVSIEEWMAEAKYTEDQVAEFCSLVDDFEDIGYKHFIGLKDTSFAYYDETTKGTIRPALMCFAGGTKAGFQPKVFYSFLEKYGYSDKIADELMDGLRNYLNKNQKNKPYERKEGYYYISIKTLLEHKSEILKLFEKFKSNF